MGKTLDVLAVPAAWAARGQLTLWGSPCLTVPPVLSASEARQVAAGGGYSCVIDRTSSVPSLLWEAVHLSREPLSRLGRSGGSQGKQGVGDPGVSQTLPLRVTQGESFDCVASVSDTQKRHKDSTILIPRTIREQWPTGHLEDFSAYFPSTRPLSPSTTAQSRKPGKPRWWDSTF